MLEVDVESVLLIVAVVVESVLLIVVVESTLLTVVVESTLLIVVVESVLLIVAVKYPTSVISTHRPWLIAYNKKVSALVEWLEYPNPVQEGPGSKPTMDAVG